MLLLEAVEVHETLNPKLWNSDNTLKPEVYQKLYDISQEFIKFIEIPLNIVDIEIVGSNASYNYNETSDIDLHIIVNSEVNYVDPEILRTLYNARKGSFNDNYDLSIEGIPVELYIEDVKDGNATNGRFSISKNEWIKFPEPITYKIPDISSELEKYIDKCDDALKTTNPDDIIELINEIYMMRKLGLAEGGEASVGNLVFKELRSMNMLQILKDKYYELKSEDLSLTESKKLQEDNEVIIDKIVELPTLTLIDYGIKGIEAKTNIDIKYLSHNQDKTKLTLEGDNIFIKSFYKMFNITDSNELDVDTGEDKIEKQLRSMLDTLNEPYTLKIKSTSQSEYFIRFSYTLKFTKVPYEINLSYRISPEGNVTIEIMCKGDIQNNENEMWLMPCHGTEEFIENVNKIIKYFKNKLGE